MTQINSTPSPPPLRNSPIPTPPPRNPASKKRDASPPAPTIYLTGFRCQPGDEEYASATAATGGAAPYWFEEQTHDSSGGYEYGVYKSRGESVEKLGKETLEGFKREVASIMESEMTDEEAEGREMTERNAKKNDATAMVTVTERRREVRHVEVAGVHENEATATATAMERRWEVRHIEVADIQQPSIEMETGLTPRENKCSVPYQCLDDVGDANGVMWR
ncbi:hypothetical protein EJ02DRAFT_422703 [Clathrospora elynae]|uniref:Uncharacterized protein n=1 Tax=Clathrospora elynae TaxID=706981 RepID=A0A6A5SQ57_9PLEO|nr:hypothetical protein EJ02DRAFT_422703 [Clathrospora elynae]